MIQMLSFDLDGTLLRDDKTISARTMQAILLRRRAGVKVIFATARGNSTKGLVSYPDFDGYVLHNGALGFAGGDLVHDKTIAPGEALPILRALDRLGIAASAEHGGVHYTNQISAMNRWDPENRYLPSDFTEFPGATGKINALVERPEHSEVIRSAVPDGFYMSVSKDNYVMIMKDGATKSAAVFALAAALGIAPDEIAAFGDDANDIDLLIHCGYSVAMENALDSVKDAARFVCGDNNRDGIAAWLDEHLPVRG